MPRGSWRRSVGENEEEPSELPSSSFCRALDREAEFDANDAFADELVEKHKDARPSRQTEVLDNDIFEEGSRLREALGTASQDKNEDASASHLGSLNPDQVLDNRQNGKPSSAKRVRFAPSPERTRTPVALPENNNQFAEQLQKQPQKRSSSHRPRSYVPDHVRHPEKYTVYTLDEAITVGSGDSGAAEDRAGNAQAARAAKNAAAMVARDMDVDGGSAPNSAQEIDELPAFGGGIEFKPRKAAKPSDSFASTSHAAADRVNGGAVAAHFDENVGDAPLGDAKIEHLPTQSSAAQSSEFQPRHRKARNLRSRK